MMLENMGYNPVLLFNEKSGDVPDFMKSIRSETMDQIVRNPRPVHAYIEIGMSINPSLRDIFHKLGARNIKIYLGNILNIDLETPIFYSHMNFSHHVIGSMDEIWTSPHYEMHREYSAILNHVPVKPETCKIAAYVWEPDFLTNFGRRSMRWTAPTEGEPSTILIMEPNISFQKASIIPILIVEAYARARPEWNCKVVVINGSRLEQIPYSKDCFLSRLDLYRNGRLELTGRMDMKTALEK
jgi:hypothetical protein